MITLCNKTSTKIDDISEAIKISISSQTQVNHDWSFWLLLVRFTVAAFLLWLRKVYIEIEQKRRQQQSKWILEGSYWVRKH